MVRMSYTPEFKTRHRSVHISVGRSPLISRVLQKTEGHNRSHMAIYGVSSEEGVSPGGGERMERGSICLPVHNKYTAELPYAVLFWVCMQYAREELLEKEIDQRRFGNIMHDALCRLYEPLKGEGRGLSSLRWRETVTR
ncbi:MAG: hypothetical protein R2758_15905 [Bacteroidales bacterium]